MLYVFDIVMGEGGADDAHVSIDCWCSYLVYTTACDGLRGVILYFLRLVCDGIIKCCTEASRMTMPLVENMVKAIELY